MFTANSSVDPSGITVPGGENPPFPNVVQIEPNQFSVTDILASSSKTETGGDIVLKIGNLAPLNDQSAGTDVSEIDLASIYVGRNLKPLQVQIAGETEGKREGFDGAFIEIMLPRLGVLRYLQKAQPSKPPMPGDVVDLPVHGRLKNGLAFYGFTAVRVIGPP